MRALAFVFYMITIHFFSGGAFAQTNARVKTSRPPLILAEEDQRLFEKMNQAQKIGQMFFIGFMGKTAGEGLATTIREVRPGGVILFSRNIHAAPQVVALTRDAQRAALKASGVPLLIGVDQEGGDVIRIKTALPLPSALAFGEAGETSLVETAGEATGHLLKILGINMNFAPVLDINDPSKPSFIGTRTYGSEPKIVSQMGASFARGMRKVHVLPTGKHFPGHGGLDGDSHQATPSKDLTLEELRASDLVPFTEMQKSFGNGWAVMLGHIAYPNIDSSGVPATFSKTLVSGLLREQIGFEGLIVTDDIQMGGAAVIEDVHERTLRAVEAGADMIMVAWNKKLQRALSQTLARAVKSGRLPISRIDESVKRILIAKREFASLRENPPSNEELRLAIRNPKFDQVAERAMAIRFGREPQPRELEFREYAEGKNLLVFSSNTRFSENFKRALPARHLRFYPLDFERPDLIERAMRANPRSAGVFYVSGSQSAKVLNKLSEDVTKRMLIVSVETQGELKNVDQFGSIANVYYRHPALGKLIANHYFAQPRRPASAPSTRKHR